MNRIGRIILFRVALFVVALISIVAVILAANVNCGSNLFVFDTKLQQGFQFMILLLAFEISMAVNDLLSLYLGKNFVAAYEMKTELGGQIISMRVRFLIVYPFIAALISLALYFTYIVNFDCQYRLIGQ